MDKADVARIVAASGVPQDRVYDVLWAAADLGYALTKPAVSSGSQVAALDAETIAIAFTIGDLPPVTLEVSASEVTEGAGGLITCILTTAQATALCDAWASAHATRGWTMTGASYRSSLKATLHEAFPSGVVHASWDELLPVEWDDGLFDTGSCPFTMTAIICRA